MLNRKVLFQEMIYNDDLKLIEITEQRWRNIISLAIKRNIFRVFFNNLVSVSCIKTVMSPVNDKDDAFIVSVSYSFRNENSANLLHKYRSKKSLSDIMLSSNLLQNFIQTNLQNQSKHIMLYDLNLTQFDCIEFTEIIVRIVPRWVNQRKSGLNSAWSLEIAITEY